MADEPQTPPPANSPEARTPEGQIIDQSTATTPESGKTNTAQSPEGKNERSFLNREPAPTGDKPPASNEGDKKPEDADGKQPEAPQGAPEKYEDFKLPDGYTFDPEALKEVTELFKEANLPQAQAQKLVDYYANNSLKAAQAPYELWANTQKEWVDEIANRFGSRTDTMRTDINKGIDAVLVEPKLNKAFREALDFTGAGSNPDFFEALSRFVKPFLEGTSVPQGGPSKEGQIRPAADTRPTPAEALYGHLRPAQS